MTTAQEIIAKIAGVSAAVGWQSGTGGCELAGMNRALDWSKGCLTFRNTKGDITTPQELRVACQVRDMKKAAGA